MTSFKNYITDKNIKVIGGADGPTAIYVTSKMNPLAIGFAVGTVFGMFISIITIVRHLKKNG